MAADFIFDASDFLRKVDRTDKRAQKQVDRAVNVLGDKLLEKSRNLVPMDETTLRGTGNVKQTGRMEVTVGYGGEAAKYALYQHEGGDGKRKVRNYSTPGTGPKYLEKPLFENKALWRKLFGQVMSEVF